MKPNEFHNTDSPSTKYQETFRRTDEQEEVICPAVRPPILPSIHLNSIRDIIIHITESKIHISYSENLDSTLILIFYYFTCHPFPTLARIIAKGTFKRHRKCHYSSQRPEKL